MSALPAPNHAARTGRNVLGPSVHAQRAVHKARNFTIGRPIVQTMDRRPTLARRPLLAERPMLARPRAAGPEISPSAGL